MIAEGKKVVLVVEGITSLAHTLRNALQEENLSCEVVLPTIEQEP